MKTFNKDPYRGRPVMAFTIVTKGKGIIFLFVGMTLVVTILSLSYNLPSLSGGPQSHEYRLHNSDVEADQKSPFIPPNIRWSKGRWDNNHLVAIPTSDLAHQLLNAIGSHRVLKFCWFVDTHL